jgi:hypothetical protein
MPRPLREISIAAAAARFSAAHGALRCSLLSVLKQRVGGRLRRWLYLGHRFIGKFKILDASHY